MASKELVLNTLPEALRVQFAQHDINHMSIQAEKNVAVHKYTVDARTEVLTQTFSESSDNGDAVRELRRRLQKETSGETGPKGHSIKTIARHISNLSSKNSQKVSRRHITKDVLSKIHPDLQSDKENTDLEEIFKSLTGSIQDEDDILSQGLYAQAVGRSAQTDTSPSATRLEEARYKTWIALQASKGEFDSTDQVDTWKERELSLAPVTARAGILLIIRDLYIQHLLGGVDEAGRIRIPSSLHEDFEAATQAFNRLSARTEKTKELKEDADFEKLDTLLFPSLIEFLKEELGKYAHETEWSYVHISTARAVAGNIRIIAEEIRNTMIMSQEEAVQMVARAAMSKFISLRN